MSRTLARYLTILGLALLASCGANGQSNHQAKGEATVDNTTVSKLSLLSDAFKDGEPIGARYTCDGADETPALHWGEAPAGTRSFALVVEDPDAPNGTFRHWGVFDIPASARSIGGGHKLGSEVTNDFGKPGYGGPCPPKDHGVHHYHFRLFALDVERLALSPSSKIADIEGAARGHVLAEGELIGTYERR